MTFLFRKATSMDAFLVPQTTDSDADADNDATAPTDSDAADPDEDSDATEKAEWSVEPLTDLAGCPQLSGADRWMEAARIASPQPRHGHEVNESANRAGSTR